MVTYERLEEIASDKDNFYRDEIKAMTCAEMANVVLDAALAAKGGQ